MSRKIKSPKQPMDQTAGSAATGTDEPVLPMASPEQQEQENRSGSVEDNSVDAFHATVRELAHSKWEAAGCPPGDGFDFWLEAEREVNANSGGSGS